MSAKTHLNRINVKLDTTNRVHIAVLVERARISNPETARTLDL